MIPERTSVRAVIRKGDKFLLVQRVSSSSLGGYWEFAGGKTDGESPELAVKREVEEETGLKATQVRRIKVLYEKERNFWIAVFLVSASGNISLQESEVSNSGWFTKQEARKLPLTPETKRIFSLF